ncbi:hypothetical protein BH20ACT23_BH20ACT23_19800 [soil metagenome]
MTDVMWAHPDGSRTLLAPSAGIADFVGSIYEFDSVEVVTFSLIGAAPNLVHVRAGELEVELHGGGAKPIFGRRPRLLRRSTRWIELEDSLLRPLVGRFVIQGAEGVRGHGLSPKGVREWYAIDSYRPVVAGRASIGSRDLGPLGPVDPPVRVGFSEFPREPAVECAPVLEFPST